SSSWGTGRDCHRDPGLSWHGLTTALAVALAGSYSDARRRARIARRSCVSLRLFRLVPWRNESVDLFHPLPRHPLPHRHSFSPHSSSPLWAWRPFHPQLSGPPVAHSGGPKFSHLLGDLGVSQCDHLAAQHVWQPGLYPDELSLPDSNCLGHRHLGS